MTLCSISNILPLKILWFLILSGQRGKFHSPCDCKTQPCSHVLGFCFRRMWAPVLWSPDPDSFSTQLRYLERLRLKLNFITQLQKSILNISLISQIFVSSPNVQTEISNSSPNTDSSICVSSNTALSFEIVVFISRYPLIDLRINNNDRGFFLCCI